MELPANPEAYIAESQLRRGRIQQELARLATEHEDLLAVELQIQYELKRIAYEKSMSDMYVE